MEGRPDVMPLLRAGECPRCRSPIEADAMYCCRCRLLLEEGAALKEGEADSIMDVLMEHLAVQEAIKRALREMLEGKRITI